MKHLSLALQMYAQDYDKKLPRAWFGRDAGPSDARVNYKWMDAAFPYVKSEAIFVCPADSMSKPYHFRQGNSYGSYLFNDAYFAPGDKMTPPGGQSLEGRNLYTIMLACGGGSGGFRFGWPDAKAAPKIEEHRFGDIKFLHSWQRVPVTSQVGGMAFSYSAQQVFAPREVNGRTIYAGLTIEDD